jgi:hypothetical protein
MNQKNSRLWVIVALLVFTLAGCGGSEEAAATATAAPAAPATAAPVATAQEAGAEVEPVSPLTEPASPLTQPSSPLPAGEPAAGAAGPRIEIAVPSDIGIITQVAQDTKAPAPQEGMASLSGVLYSPVINRIIPGTQFYLTPAIEEGGKLFIPSLFDGPKEAEGDVAGVSNESGQLLLDDVPPGDYYLAVWTIYNWPLAFGAVDDKLPLLITLEAGEQRDLGLLYVEWP